MAVERKFGNDTSTALAAVHGVGKTSVGKTRMFGLVFCCHEAKMGVLNVYATEKCNRLLHKSVYCERSLL